VVIGQESIGVGVIVVRGAAVLFGMRRGPHGASSWSFPGGHLDGDESVEACAIRELHEEAGIEVINARVVAETEDEFGVGFRYRTLFVQGDWAGGEPTVREPDKCANGAGSPGMTRRSRSSRQWPVAGDRVSASGENRTAWRR
jgi:8-oxo-dGTP diphosphatase